MVPTTIFKMFGQSPIRPLQDHMAKVTACANQLQKFFSAVFAQNWDDVEHNQQIISELESEADNIKTNLRLHLPKSLFMPVSRSDILDLLQQQDTIADIAQDIAGIILGRKLAIPHTVATSYSELLTRCLDAVNQANRTIHHLDELLETGFKGSEATVVEEMIHELNKIETDTDEIQIAVRRELYQLEDDLSPINVMFLYKIIEWTGRLADAASRVGSKLQLLMAR